MGVRARIPFPVFLSFWLVPSKEWRKDLVCWILRRCGSFTSLRVGLGSCNAPSSFPLPWPLERSGMWNRKVMLLFKAASDWFSQGDGLRCPWVPVFVLEQFWLLWLWACSEHPHLSWTVFVERWGKSVRECYWNSVEMAQLRHLGGNWDMLRRSFGCSVWGEGSTSGGISWSSLRTLIRLVVVVGGSVSFPICPFG